MLMLIQFLRGYVTLRIAGPFTERFINICIRRGMFLWDVQKIGQNSAVLKMSMRAFLHLPPIAKKTHTRVRILEKRGLPIHLSACKRRQMFAVGLLAAIVFLYVSSLFLWSVEIDGTNRVDEAQIRSVLYTLGVRPGAYKRRISLMDVKENALLQLDGLSWLWVEIHGCRAQVHVLEKRPAPEIISTAPCDIVAASDGIISEVIATEGQTKVQIGDTVLRGQVLISSVYTSAREGTPARYTHAAGQVFARTWYEKSITVPLAREEKQLTETTVVRRRLKLGKFTMPLSAQGTPKFAQSERTHTAHDLVLFGRYTGITYETDTFTQYTTQLRTLTLAEAQSLAEAELDAQIAAALTDKKAARTAVQTTHTDNGDGTITFTRTAEYKEQIGVEKAVEEL